MKIHDNAKEYLQKILDEDTTGNKMLKIVKDGCSWHANFKIVLEEQIDTDVILSDNGFKILVNRTLFDRADAFMIQYITTMAGSKLVIR